MQVPPVGPTSGNVNPQSDALAQTQQLIAAIAQVKSGDVSQKDQAMQTINNCIEALQQDTSGLSPQIQTIIDSFNSDPLMTSQFIANAGAADVLLKALNNPSSVPTDPTNLLVASVFGQTMSYLQKPYSGGPDDVLSDDFAGIMSQGRELLQMLHAPLNLTPPNLIDQLRDSFNKMTDSNYGQNNFAASLKEASSLWTQLQPQLGLG